MRYSSKGYQIKLLATRVPVLLVEGPDDKNAFSKLIESFDVANSHYVMIDSADMLESPANTGMGNREKVEEVCSLMRDEDRAPPFVGFVDREHREILSDEGELIAVPFEHFEEGNLIWTKGHSMENYYFARSILSEVFRRFVASSAFAEYLERYNDVWDSIVRTGVALSIAAYIAESTRVVSRSLGPNVIAFDSEEGVISPSQWHKVLVENLSLADEHSKLLVELYKREFRALDELRIVSEHGRWVCHGHIGMRLFWVSFARLLEDLGCCSSVISGFNGASESVRRNVCAVEWADQSVKEDAEFPRRVMERLGLLQSS